MHSIKVKQIWQQRKNNERQTNLSKRQMCNGIPSSQAMAKVIKHNIKSKKS